MSTINDGGPIAANQIQIIPMGDGFSKVTRLESVGGLTIRDYFAGMALQGTLASLALSEADSVIMVSNRGGIDAFQRRLAESAYEYADVMLEARARKDGKP